MRQFDTEHATLLATTMRQSLADGRWHTDRYTESVIGRVDRVLATPCDDAEQIAMRNGMLSVIASDLFVLAQGAWLDGSLERPSAMETRLLSPGRPRHFDDFPLDNVVVVSFTDRPVPLARAA